MPESPFVSYAQHGEDVILWRAFGGRTDGTYVDVGAYDPTADSVTRALYERGWHGVNIEPGPGRIDSFEDARPRDVNLAIAIGDEDGTATLTIPDLPGWSSLLPEDRTGVDPATARHVEVPVRRLDTLLPELGIEHVDVLKIDVEGNEPAVVRGLLGGPVRPTVCVVEGVAPGVGRIAGDEAVALLVEVGYRHCLFDGLNHYLTLDDSLADALAIPASPIDEYVPIGVQLLVDERAQLHARIEELAAQIEGRVAMTPAESPARGEDAEDLPVPLAPDSGRPQAPAELDASATAPVHPAARSEERTARRRSTVGRILGGGQEDAIALAVGPQPHLLDAGPLPADAAVALLYREILGREVDEAGLLGWTDQLGAGTSLVQVARGLLGSAEFAARPAAVRATTLAAVDEWQLTVARQEVAAPYRARLGVLGGGTVHDEILVRALFAAGLHREPTTQELHFEADKLRSGIGRDTLVGAFGDRPDVRARLLGTIPTSVRQRLRRLVEHGASAAAFRSLVAEAESRLLGALLTDESSVQEHAPLTVAGAGGDA